MKNPKLRNNLISGNWITGFTDADGNFSINFQESSKKVSASFKITISEANVFILEQVKDYFGCGSIVVDNAKNKTLKFVVSNRKVLIEKVIPHFDRYPLQSSKLLDFIDWRSAVLLMNDKYNLDEILSIKDKMNSNRSQKDKYLFMESKEYNISPSWVQGFIEGEGCFYCYVPKVFRNVYCTLEIAQHSSNVKLLEEISKFFKSGNVSPRHNQDFFEGPVKPGSVSRYKTYSHSSIRDFINVNPLYTTKYIDFLCWENIARVKDIGLMNTDLGRSMIDEMKSKMNYNRDAKIIIRSYQDLIRHSSPLITYVDKIMLNKLDPAKKESSLNLNFTGVIKKLLHLTKRFANKLSILLLFCLMIALYVMGHTISEDQDDSEQDSQTEEDNKDDYQTSNEYLRPYMNSSLIDLEPKDNQEVNNKIIDYNARKWEMSDFSDIDLATIESKKDSYVQLYLAFFKRSADKTEGNNDQDDNKDQAQTTVPQYSMLDIHNSLTGSVVHGNVLSILEENRLIDPSVVTVKDDKADQLKQLLDKLDQDKSISVSEETIGALVPAEVKDGLIKSMESGCTITIVSPHAEKSFDDSMNKPDSPTSDYGSTVRPDNSSDKQSDSDKTVTQTGYSSIESVLGSTRSGLSVTGDSSIKPNEPLKDDVNHNETGLTQFLNKIDRDSKVNYVVITKGTDGEGGSVPSLPQWVKEGYTFQSYDFPTGAKVTTKVETLSPASTTDPVRSPELYVQDNRRNPLIDNTEWMEKADSFDLDNLFGTEETKDESESNDTSSEEKINSDNSDTNNPK